MTLIKADDIANGSALVRLRLEHRDLDAAIGSLVASGDPDQLRLARMKKRKLALKDAIARLEDGMLPDIIA